ncbi:MAG: DUF128 domain-containing protein [Candidatus Hydrogenedentes bacterium]|nr:DUF128 domain-containing protein [Candidatus Hydrogenedentota bacterium]
MELKTGRRMVAILRVLRDLGGPAGSDTIARELAYAGFDLSERAIRNYLAQADALGWTVNLGRRGRRLTEQGVQELERALVVDKVGFVSARVDTLAYQMTFDTESLTGKLILNVSTVSPRDLRAAVRCLTQAYDANLGMGRYVAVGAAGEMIGDFRVPKGTFGIGTVCSVSINGVFLRANVPTVSRFGGLLQVERGHPKRFTQIINYDGSSLDPLEIFIRGHMTSVGQAARKGSGMLGASFREVPAVALPEVHRLIKVCERIGLGGVLAVGAPSQPLLDVPVAQGRAGIIVPGGLNAIAVVVEEGVAVTSTAMCTLCPFERLVDYHELHDAVRARGG